MPIYRPGGRRCSTKSERLLFIRENERRKCDAKGCTKNRRWTSRWCHLCDYRARRYGDPLGRQVDLELVKVYRGKMAAFIKDYSEAPAVVAALETMQRLLAGRLSPAKATAHRELRRLREAEAGPVTPEEGLEVAGAVMLLHLYRPELLPSNGLSDKRLTFAIANQLFRLRPAEYYMKQSGNTGKMYRHVRDPVCSSRQNIGGLVRKYLALFFVHVFDRMEQDYRADIRRRMALKEPIAGKASMPPLPPLSPTDQPNQQETST